MRIQTISKLVFVVALSALYVSPTLASDQSSGSKSGDQKACCASDSGAGNCGKSGCRHGTGEHGEVGCENGCGKHGRAGGGHGKQPGFGKGHGHDQRHDADRELFHFLLSNHEKITRKVTELPDGVETLTESADPEIAAKIKEHVRWMQHRVEHAKPIRRRDPLFEEIFKHTDKIEMKRTETDHGVRVLETSDDPYVAELIKAHAKAVSGFVSRGFAAARSNHEVPPKDADLPKSNVKLKQD